MFENENEETILNPEELEQALASVTDDDVDLSASVDYEKFIVLSKKEVANFIRLVEPLTRAAIDDYGKSIFVHCNEDGSVSLKFFNNPYFLTAKVSNHAGTSVRDFAINVVTFRKLVCSAFSSLILVEQDDDINIAFAGQLLFVNSQNLLGSQYEIAEKTAPLTIDKELATYTFKNVSSILSQTDRAFEKVAVVKKGQVWYNTGVFTSSSKSPFSGDDDMVVFKQVADCISTLADIAKGEIRYGIGEKSMTLKVDNYYAELPVALGAKVDEFVSASANIALQFNADIEVVNDTLGQLISIVKSLDYLSKNIKLSFTDASMDFEISTSNFAKQFRYSFPIVAGRPDVTGSMNLTAEVLQLFINLVGSDIKYSFTNQGLGIENQCGRYLLKRC